MKRKLIPGVYGAGNKGPMLLLFSPRTRMLDILTVGLAQCDYQVIQASTSYLAGIKASQMLPKMVVIDLSGENPRDILLVSRMQKSIRTSGISILLIVASRNESYSIRSIHDLRQHRVFEDSGSIEMITFPFAFADLLLKIQQEIQPSDQSGGQSVSGPEINTIVADRLFDRTIAGDKKLQAIGSVINKNWGFPFTVIKALDILESDAGCCTELAKCISTDPAVSSTILKISNTVIYARRHGRITDIRDAVVRMGFKETRNILMCLHMIELTPEVYRNRGFGRREFWLHSLTVGLIAEKLCVDSGFPRPELAFMAGLMHDLGKIPLDNNFETVFPQLLDHAMDTFAAFYESEDQLMGFTHAQLGHYLTTKWNFPPAISVAIINHHSPEHILQATPKFEKLIQESVFVANQLTKAASFGHSCDEIIEEIPVEMMRDLHLGAGPGAGFFNTILTELKQLCSYLNLQLQERNFLSENADNQDCDVLLVYNAAEVYHPMGVALRNNGFRVRQTQNLQNIPRKGKQVVISLPERGLPLDIIFYGDGNKVAGSEILKIFVVDMEQSQSMREGINEMNLIFMDRKSFDVRLLIHTIDTFFERIVIPEISDTE